MRILKTVWMRLGADLEQKGMMFSYRNYCSENAMVTADPEQLKRVINNIINNACKYNNKAKGKSQYNPDRI